MGFRDRLAQTDTLIQILKICLWDRDPLAGRLRMVDYGYETHVPDNVRQSMRFLRSATAKHIRFTPDFFVLDLHQPEQTYLLDYKVTQTPLYSPHRLAQIQSCSQIADLSWQDIGQIEADAYDNYMALSSTGIRVAILNYCSYHPPFLLWDLVQNFPILHRDRVSSDCSAGSGTPFVNFDCRSVRPFDRFLAEDHQLHLDPSHQQELIQHLREKLPTKHHPRSPYGSKP
jgi:hypothetical protein